MSTVLFGHADGALSDYHYDYPGQIESPYRLEQFRTLLNLHLLLYQSLVLPDDFALHSYYLRRTLINDYGAAAQHARFVRDGSISIAFRDQAPTATKATEAFLSNGTYNQPTYKQVADYIAFLDESLPAQPLTYSAADRYELQGEMIRHLLGDQAFVRAAGAGRIVKLITRDGRIPDEAVSRSWFWRLADEVQSKDPRTANDLRLFSSTALHLTMPTLLGLDPVYPAPLARFVRATQPQASTGAVTGIKPQERFLIAAERAGIQGSGLADLDADAIAEIRAGRPFKSLQESLQTARSMTASDRAGYEIGQAIEAYLLAIHDTLALDLVGTREQHDHLRRMSRFIAGSGIATGVAGGGAGLIIQMSGGLNVEIGVLGLVWGIASAAVPAWMNHLTARMRADARLRTITAADASAPGNGSAQFSGLI